MARKKKNEEPKKSVYYILNKWIQDGSKYTEVPEEIINDKSISQNYILYYFRSSKYISYLSSLFNNYDIYMMDKIEIFKMIKDIVLKTGYKPRFIPRSSDNRTKLFKILKDKFPFLKKYEVPLIIDMIDKSEDKDNIYETLGISKSKKEKNKDGLAPVNNSTNNDDKEEEIYSWDKLLLNFEIQELSGSLK